MHARRFLRHLHRGQANREAGPYYRAGGSIGTQRGRLAVLCPDAPVMGIDDLLRDGKAKPGILTKVLVRTLRVETLENAFHGLGRNARAVILDHDLDIAAQPATGDAHFAAPRREGTRVIDEIVHDLSEPGIVAHHHERALPAFESEADANAVVLALVCNADDGGQELCQVDRLRFLALHFRIEPARVGNIRDETV